MLRNTLLATLFVVTGVVTLQDHGGVLGQTPPHAAKRQVVSTVKVRPFEVSRLDLSTRRAKPGFYVEISRESLAVDEKGDVYLAFSIQTPAPSRRLPDEELHLVKYDKTGKLITAFPIPDFLFAHPEGLVYLSSVALSHNKVYVPAHWRDKTYAYMKSILIYTKAGRYERSLDIPGRFSPDQVVVSPTGDLFVLGRGSLDDHAPYGYAGTDTIIKLSPSGQVLTSFSPFPTDPSLAEDLSRRTAEHHLLLDEAGRLIHVLPDATMRVFDLNGRLLKKMSPTLPTGGFLHSVVRHDGLFVLTTVVIPRKYETVVSAEGDVVSLADITEQLMIKAQGRDGNYYGLSHLPRRSPTDPPELQISKLKLALSQ